MSQNQDQPPPHVTLPESQAPRVDRNGDRVVDVDGNPVMAPVVPTENAVLSEDEVRRVVQGPDGSLGEEITVIPR